MSLTSDPLVKTKLRPPEARPKLVARPRLTARLEREAGRRLTLVSAPAGFGKTTLLGGWLEGHALGKEPFAWVSLDEGDNDPARFLSHLVAALRSVEEGVGEGILSSLRSPEAPGIEAVTGALVNELASVPHEEWAIVFDDYHAIEEGSVHGIVSLLLDRLPTGAHLVVASRVDPPLPLSRLRARGQMAELRSADLRFTPEEAASFLADVMDLELSEEDAAALERRTEGWVVGLQLAALSMRDRHDVSGFVRAFSGSHRDVLDFLAEEVLYRQPEPVRDFMLETSILDRLSGPLCDAVTGANDGQAMLERLDSGNLFLIPLDDERCWYRYHHLFAEFLRGRLQREYPERVGGLHLRAAAWHEENGRASEAVRHALAAGDVERAAWLVEHNAQALFLRSEGATLDRWLSALPAELVRSRPQLSLTRAIWALIGGRVDEVEPLLANAESALAPEDRAQGPTAEGVAGGLANVPGTVARLRAELALQRGDAGRATRFARQALDHAEDDDEYLRYLSRWNQAAAALMRGRAAEAEDALAGLARNPWAVGHNRYFAVRSRHTLSQAQYAQGRLGAALETCREALELARGTDRRPLPAAGVAHLGLAEISLERNELDAALRHAAEAVALRRRLGTARWLAAALAVLARVRQARGDRDGALEAIGEAERVGPGPEVAHPFNPVPVQKARLLLLRREVAEAARWSDERALGAEDDIGYLREPEHLVLARVLIAQGETDPALRLLGKLLAAAEATGRTGSAIEILALQALALWASDEKERAVSTLARALALAEPEGYVRVFVDEGLPMAELLFQVLETRQRTLPDPPVPSHYLRKLLAAVEQEAADAVAPDQKLPEPLSERELEVLALVSAGKTNPEIAGELFVAQSTVKTHVKNIYRKLDARNRTQALSRAGELDLI